jgi:hypothetical protein
VFEFTFRVSPNGSSWIHDGMMSWFPTTHGEEQEERELASFQRGFLRGMPNLEDLTAELRNAGTANWIKYRRCIEAVIGRCLGIINEALRQRRDDGEKILAVDPECVIDEAIEMLVCESAGQLQRIRARAYKSG